MKSRAKLPVALLRGARNILIAAMVAVPVVGFALVDAEPRTIAGVNAFVNITGKVVDQDGNPVAGATVTIKGTTTGVQTDEEGVFRMNVSPENTALVVSHIGFEVREVNVAGMETITIVLESVAGSLDEVIVTGYGTQKRSEIVGSVATISGEELMDIPAPNLAGALRNRIAGVGVSQESGRPGARITLNIRGASISEQGGFIGATSEPLYIVDGITVGASVFDNLDASMVESITFLKDASAAIYGAAGAKGVVLITTKRGKQEKPSISYNGYVGVTDVARRPDVLSSIELAEFMNDVWHANSEPESRFFSEDDLAYLRGLNTESWYDQLWKGAILQKHNLSISGGGEQITFFAGGSYQNENGNYPGIKQDKYTMRSGLTATILEGLKADIAFNVDHRIRDSKNGSGNNDAFSALIGTPDWVPMYINGLPVNTESDNPLALINSGYYQRSKTSNYRINASLTYQPEFLEGLTAKLQVSQGGGNGTSSQYQPAYKLYNFERMGSNDLFYSSQLVDEEEPFDWGRTTSSARLNSGLNRSNSWQGFVTLSYANTFAGHTIDAVVGGEQTMSNDEDLGVYWLNQLLPDFEDYWAFDLNTLELDGRNIGESTKRSFFGRLGYNFNKKYIVSFVGRLDASSNFAKGHRWGLSPSVGAAWVVSEEGFFKDHVPFVNYLKVKANWGITGDDRVSKRLWQERYTLDENNGYMFGNDRYGVGLNPAVFPNLNITWEKKRSVNVGIEAAILDNKLNLGVEFFQNKTFDGFDKGGNEMLPLYSGLEAPVINYREVYNWGSEFSIGYNTLLAKDLSLSTSVNFGFGNSVITEIIYAKGNYLATDLSDGDWLGNRFGTDPRKYNGNNIGYRTNGMFRTQEQVDAFLVAHPNYTLDGTIPQPGWLIYEDANGDGMVNTLDQVLLFDRTTPAFAAGISLGLKYKSFSLSTNINARFGGKEFYDRRARELPDGLSNVPAFWKDRWTRANPMSGKFPRADDPLANVNSEFWAVNGTMIRINNMTVSYNVPSTLANRMGFGGLRVLLTGNNLWTLVNPFSYKDPYSSGFYDYPTVRTISVGLSVNL